jgi:menaquinone-dependent protoporphyrinogen oxidase
MSNRILVAYASPGGSTAEIASAIAQTLRQAGAEVDVAPVEEAAGLDGYDALVLGSAIRAGKLQPGVLRFAERHAAAMAALPVAYFVVCATLREDTPENRLIAHGYLEPLRRIKVPVDEGLFAGRIDHRTVGFPFNLVLRLMKAAEGDWRDWDGIRTWASELAPRLAGAALARR